MDIIFANSNRLNEVFINNGVYAQSLDMTQTYIGVDEDDTRDIKARSGPPNARSCPRA
jgi:hypothetical protein